jgi:hypothetical protein
MSKLYAVRVGYEFVIVADSLGDAYARAPYYVRDALSDISGHDVDLDIDEYDGTNAESWDDECIPYGGDGNTRTGEYPKLKKD